MTNETCQPNQFGVDCSKGGDNTYSHACEVYGGRRHYAMCLRVMERCDDETSCMYRYDENCRKAIHSGEKFCPALAMRANEKQAGYAIYYVPREKAGLPPIPRDQIFSQSYERGYKGNTRTPPRGPDRVIPSHTSGSPSRTPVVRRPFTRVEPKVDMSNLHGELVNTMLKEEAK